MERVKCQTDILCKAIQQGEKHLLFLRCGAVVIVIIFILINGIFCVDGIHFYQPFKLLRCQKPLLVESFVIPDLHSSDKCLTALLGYFNLILWSVVLFFLF